MSAKDYKSSFHRLVFPPSQVRWVHASYFTFLCSAFCDWTCYESGFRYHQHHRHHHPNHASRHLYTRLVLLLFDALLATKPKTPARHSCEAQSSLQGNFCHTWSHFGRYFTTQSANSHIKKEKIFSFILQWQEGQFDQWVRQMISYYLCLFS